MKKLSKTQLEVLNKIIKDVEKARMFERYEDWHKFQYTFNNLKYTYDDNHERFCESVEIYNKKYSNGAPEWEREYYNKFRNGYSLTHCNTRTLEALEKAGYIEIEEIDDYDWVKWTGKKYEA